MRDWDDEIICELAYEATLDSGAEGLLWLQGVVGVPEGHGRSRRSTHVVLV